MASWLIVLLYVVAILTIVLIHEAGHFTFAKLFKIKVEEFFVGFGPRIWSFRRGETEYGLKALPLGGYVRIAGMNPFEEPPAEERDRTFGSKPPWQRAVVIGAGPITHFVMAILLLAVFFAFIGVPKYQPVVVQVCAISTQNVNACPAKGEPSPAQLAGLRPGDVIVSVDGHRDVSDDALKAYTQRHIGRPMTLAVKRRGRMLTVTATPRATIVNGHRVGRMGVELGPGAVLRRIRTNPVAAIGKGAVGTWDYTVAVLGQLGHIFGPSGLKRIGQLLLGHEQRTTSDVSSIVGGGQLVVEAAKAGAWDVLLGILVGFNVFIGILNLVPLPPLDGGHLAVIVYEKVRRRRPDVRKLVPVTALVMAFMILFAVSVTYLDIVRPLPNPFR